MNGTLQTVAGRPTLRFERRLKHPVEKVWKAITDPAELAHWFPDKVEVDGATSADGGLFTVGAKLRFLFEREVVMEGKPLPDFEGEVLEADPPRVLSYTWGEDVLRFELIPDGDGCLLVFTDTISERGKAARDGAGWHVCLEALVARLDGTVGPADDRWKGLYDTYIDTFGSDAATAPLPDIKN